MCTNLFHICQQWTLFYAAFGVDGRQSERDIFGVLPEHIEEGYGCLRPQHDEDVLVTWGCCVDV